MITILVQLQAATAVCYGEHQGGNLFQQFHAILLLTTKKLRLPVILYQQNTEQKDFFYLLFFLVKKIKLKSESETVSRFKKKIKLEGVS